ncbi:MAG: hypothetical protein NC397_05605 [Clostridium sp.]|nr:hypothetical protein [Clostridium sp.]
MDNKTFIDILNSRSMTFTTKELQDMIDEELEKDPDEMDVDLIELCLDALNGKFDKEPIKNKTKKRIKISKALLIAAIFIVILSITIPVGAKYINMNASPETVKYNGEYFDIDLQNTNSGKLDELNNLLNENDIASLTVPSAILDGKWTIGNSYVTNDPIKSLYIDFRDTNSDLNGYISVLYYTDINFINGKSKADNEFENIYESEIDGIKTIVLNNDNESCLYYTYQNCEYSININCDFDTAKSIITTIKTEVIENEN